jgi:hypothetical protein
MSLLPSRQEIAEAQENDPNVHNLTRDPKYTSQLVENAQALCKGTAMVLPTALWHRAIHRYHHYLPATHLKETLCAAMYWKGMQNIIWKYFKNCQKCQVNKWHKHKYIKVPTKLVYKILWSYYV